MWNVLCVPCFFFFYCLSCASKYSEAGLTDEAKDVSDGGHEDDQHVVECQDGSGNQHVASPAELSLAEQQCGDGGADLGNKHKVLTFQSLARACRFRYKSVYEY